MTDLWTFYVQSRVFCYIWSRLWCAHKILCIIYSITGNGGQCLSQNPNSFLLIIYWQSFGRKNIMCNNNCYYYIKPRHGSYICIQQHEILQKNRYIRLCVWTLIASTQFKIYEVCSFGNFSSFPDFTTHGFINLKIEIALKTSNSIYEYTLLILGTQFNFRKSLIYRNDVNWFTWAK